MADEKKYTAQEAAIAVLAKAQELLSKSELAKADVLATKPGKVSPGGHVRSAARAFAHAKNPNASSPKIEREMGRESMAAAKQGHKEKLSALQSQPKPNLPKSEDMSKFEAENPNKENEIGTKFGKAENQEKPSNSMAPKISEAPDSSNPPNKVQDQKAPQSNPAEQKEGNNPPSGAVPGNGVMKLFHFVGHIKGKKKKGMVQV